MLDLSESYKQLLQLFLVPPRKIGPMCQQSCWIFWMPISDFVIDRRQSFWKLFGLCSHMQCQLFVIFLGYLVLCLTFVSSFLQESFHERNPCSNGFMTLRIYPLFLQMMQYVICFYEHNYLFEDAAVNYWKMFSYYKQANKFILSHLHYLKYKCLFLHHYSYS